MLHRRNRAKTGGDLWYLEKVSDNEWTGHPFLENVSDENWGRFSPDGRYVAYVSRESGQDKVYVCDFPHAERKTPVSKNGGNSPHWNADGSELFYVEGNVIVSVPVSTTAEFAAGQATALFPLSGSGFWDVFPDGKRFLIVEPVGERPEPSIHVVLNWHQEFRGRERR